jgi:hypothetical protein
MGWTGRAAASDGSQGTPRACQEKERRHGLARPPFTQ